MSARVGEKFDPPHCHFTHEIIIEPVVAYCAEADEELTDEKIASAKGHVFEDLALRQYFWYKKQKEEPFGCPICQSSRVIKKVVPDEELAEKIKTQFRDFNDENKRVYNEQADDIKVDLSEYADRPIPKDLDGVIEAEITGIGGGVSKKEAGEKIDDEYAKQKKAYDEVQYYIETGDLDTAEEKALKLADLFDRNDCLEKLLIKYLEKDLLEKTEKLAPKSDFLDIREKYTKELIVKYIEKEELKKAENLSSVFLFITDIDKCRELIILKYLALYQFNLEYSPHGLKNLKEARKITSLLTKSFDRNHFYEKCFDSCIQLDNLEGARNIIFNDITKTYISDRLSEKLIYIYINRPNYDFEDLKKAFAYSSKIGNSWYKKECYKKILKAAIKLPYDKDNYLWLKKILEYFELHYINIDNDVAVIINAHLNADNLSSAMKTVSFSLLNPKEEIRLKVANAYLNRNPVTENNLKKAINATSSILSKSIYKKEINDLYVNISQKALENKFYRQSFSAMNRVTNFFTFQRLFFKTIGVWTKNTCISFFRAVGLFTYKTLYVLSTPIRFVVSKIRRRRGY